MNAQPDPGTEFRAFLDRVRRRVRGLAAMRAMAGALVLSAAGLLLVGLPGSKWAAGLLVLTAIATVGAAAVFVTARSRARAAELVERRAPLCRNLLITASEILDGDQKTPGYVRARVFADAARVASTLDIGALAPAKQAVLAMTAGVAVLSVALALADARPARARSAPSPSSDRAATIASIDIEIVPPAYAKQPSRTWRDPARVEALAGSQIRVTVSADAGTLALETLDGTRMIDPAGPRRFLTAIVAGQDGFLAIQAAALDGSAGDRRLIGLSVSPDALPRVRATAPGKDLVLASGAQTVPLTIDAEDDLGLASLALRYTKVAGSGESFTFTDGEVPLEIRKTSDRAWAGRAQWRLHAFELQPGDMIIYRGVATDGRPGAPPAESETFVIEIAAPGALASEGFAIDDRENKYAISQQMVILKTERLLAARRSMPAAEFRESALDLAAEQRQVRAEFVFMMGGELADAGLDITTLNEEEEAAGEDDLAAGRLVNQGRLDLLRAIRSMSRAAARLADIDVTAALPIEKQALASLQRAFSRSRYILRTLGERERLDLSRRLTGVLAALARPSRPAAEAAPTPRVTALRRVLADVAALASGAAGPSADRASRVAILAQRVLEIDPASSDLRDVASALSAVAASGSPPGSPDHLYRAALRLAAVVRAEVAAAPERSPDPEAAALAGALADALAGRSVRR